jgi:glycerol dehydrogenase
VLCCAKYNTSSVWSLRSGYSHDWFPNLFENPNPKVKKKESKILFQKNKKTKTAVTDLKVFASPERYVQGRNATQQLGAEMKKLGMKGPVIIVSSQSPRRLLEATWSKCLPEAGYNYSYMAFSGTCTVEEAERIAAQAKKQGAKTLIAFGGGQVIDAVRTASGIVGDEDDSVVEVVSCPTVASTDAPCSTLCVLYHADHTFHQYRFTRRHPTLVLVDTEVVAQAPRRMLVGGLGDALATWFEARTVAEAHANNFVGGKSTETSSALAKLCYEILIADGAAAVQSVDSKAVTPALERVVEANTLLSGLGFESGGLCVAHSVHNGLTSQPSCVDYTHGEKVAFGLLVQLVLEGRPATEVETILKCCSSVGLPITLRDVGVEVTDAKAIAAISERSLAPGDSSHNEPFQVTVPMMEDAIRAADRMGTLYKEGRAT